MGWIKTSDKLPNLYETVIVTVKDYRGVYTTSASLQKISPIEWEHGIYDFGADEILAWMPLPEPWKGE